VALKILDGHNDVISALLHAERGGKTRTFFERQSEGHIDLPRSEEGGFAGGLFSIYVGADPQAEPASGPVLGEHDGKPVRFPRPLTLEYAQRTSMAEIGILFRLERQSNGKLRVVRAVSDVERCLHDGAIAAVIHFEGAEAIDARLDMLDAYYAMGLRSVGPVWSRPNDFGEGVPYLFPHSPDTGPGLTDAGKALVRRCNELGIVVDVSHLNEKGFWDIVSISTAPMVATHSSVWALTPTPRNLTDRQLDAVRDSGGIVGVNFANSFLREDGGEGADVPMERIVAHFRYLADRMGVDHVGFGADLDGATVPSVVGDVAGLPRVVDALRAAGFDEADLEKMTHGNWLRVLGKIWKSE
jgi:membrane dipeptidase